jgi:hypothetical protein
VQVQARRSALDSCWLLPFAFHAVLCSQHKPAAKRSTLRSPTQAASSLALPSHAQSTAINQQEQQTQQLPAPCSSFTAAAAAAGTKAAAAPNSQLASRCGQTRLEAFKAAA